MAFNFQALIGGISTIANHPLTKGTGVATLISSGLYVALAAGVAIPGWAFTLGPIVGYAAYKLLPVKDQIIVDKAAEDVVDVVTEIPKVYSASSDFPEAPPSNPSPSNINKG